VTDNIVSFKQAKKRAGYKGKEKQAAENRKKFGRNKSEKHLGDFETAKTCQHVDAHKLDD